MLFFYKFDSSFLLDFNIPLPCGHMILEFDMWEEESFICLELLSLLPVGLFLMLHLLNIYSFGHCAPCFSASSHELFTRVIGGRYLILYL